MLISSLSRAGRSPWGVVSRATVGRNDVQQVSVSNMSRGMVPESPGERLLVPRADPEQTVGVDKKPPACRRLRTENHVRIPLQEVLDQVHILPVAEVAVTKNPVSEPPVDNPLVHVWDQVRVIAQRRNAEPEQQ